MKKIIVALLLYTLTSCGVNEPSRVVKSYFPLAVGNKWYYSSDKEEDINRATKWEVIGTADINSHKYYVVDKRTPNRKSTTTYYRYQNSKVLELIITRDEKNPYFETIFADLDTQKDEAFNYYPGGDFIDALYYVVTLVKRTRYTTTLFYDIPKAVDEEYSITFESGKGISEIHNYGWDSYSYLIYYELR